MIVACRSSEEKPEDVAAVDVPPILTVDVEDDIQEVQRTPELVGVLPGDFPPDLPLYAPSSLIDFGTREDGQRYVVLISPHSRSRVAGALENLLRGQGWGLEPGPQGSLWLRKDGRRLRLVYEEAGPGARYRFEY